MQAALSEPMTPAQIAALDARLERGRSGRRPLLQGRALRRSVLLVAAVVIALPLAVIAGIVPGSDEVPPPPDLENGVAGLFSQGTCVGPQMAEQQINSLLTDLGYADWKVEHGTGAATTECVVPALDAQTRTITLFMALSPGVYDGLAAVREQLYRDCRTRDEAAALVEAVLRDAGRAPRSERVLGVLDNGMDCRRNAGLLDRRRVNGGVNGRVGGRCSGRPHWGRPADISAVIDKSGHHRRELPIHRLTAGMNGAAVRASRYVNAEISAKRGAGAASCQETAIYRRPGAEISRRGRWR